MPPTESYPSEDAQSASAPHRRGLAAKSPAWWRLPLTLLPTVGVTLLPKCPLCLMGIMSALGFSTLISVAWLQPLTLSLLGVAVISLALRARRSCGYKPFLLGLLAAVIVFVGKFYADYAPATYGGLALLFAATLWNAKPRERATPRGDDCRC